MLLGGVLVTSGRVWVSAVDRSESMALYVPVLDRNACVCGSDAYAAITNWGAEVYVLVALNLG